MKAYRPEKPVLRMILAPGLPDQLQVVQGLQILKIIPEMETQL